MVSVELGVTFLSCCALAVLLALASEKSSSGYVSVALMFAVLEGPLEASHTVACKSLWYVLVQMLMLDSHVPEYFH